MEDNQIRRITNEGGEYFFMEWESPLHTDRHGFGHTQKTIQEKVDGGLIPVGDPMNIEVPVINGMEYLSWNKYITGYNLFMKDSAPKDAKVFEELELVRENGIPDEDMFSGKRVTSRTYKIQYYNIN